MISTVIMIVVGLAIVFLVFIVVVIAMAARKRFAADEDDDDVDLEDVTADSIKESKENAREIADGISKMAAHSVRTSKSETTPLKKKDFKGDWNPDAADGMVRKGDVCLKRVRTAKGGDGKMQLMLKDIKRLYMIMQNADTDKITIIGARPANELRSRRDRKIIEAMNEEMPDFTPVDIRQITESENDDGEDDDAQMRTLVFMEKIEIPHSLSLDICAF